MARNCLPSPSMLPTAWWSGHDRMRFNIKPIRGKNGLAIFLVKVEGEMGSGEREYYKTKGYWVRWKCRIHRAWVYHIVSKNVVFTAHESWVWTCQWKLLIIFTMYYRFGEVLILPVQIWRTVLAVEGMVGEYSILCTIINYKFFQKFILLLNDKFNNLTIILT